MRPIYILHSQSVYFFSLIILASRGSSTNRVIPVYEAGGWVKGAFQPDFLCHSKGDSASQSVAGYTKTLFDVLYN